ncbi:MAG: hypothetical protein QOH96_3394 [Blastocatellia bacterium]|nr:hypothetical protein [Blastocatellia bacterium]
MFLVTGVPANWRGVQCDVALKTRHPRLHTMKYLQQSGEHTHVRMTEMFLSLSVFRKSVGISVV